MESVLFADAMVRICGIIPVGVPCSELGRAALDPPRTLKPGAVMATGNNYS